jgi:hypothetical protein
MNAATLSREELQQLLEHELAAACHPFQGTGPIASITEVVVRLRVSDEWIDARWSVDPGRSMDGARKTVLPGGIIGPDPNGT